MTSPINPINQRFQQNVVLDATGAGRAVITTRADFLLQRTRWLVQGGTGTNQATVENYIDDVPFEGSQSGNNDQSSSVRLLPAQSTITAAWTGGPPGGTATVYVWGLEFPAGKGMQALRRGAGALSGGTGPGNPILGGDTLIRDSIQSADYVPNTTGWAIFRDGSIDMNNGAFRGQIVVNSADGSAVIIAPNAGGKVEFEPLDVTGVTKLANGEIFSSVASFAGGHYAFMTLNTPRIMDASGTVGQVSIEILTRPTNGGVFPGFTVSNNLFEVGADIQCHGVFLGNSDMHIQGNGAIDGHLTLGPDQTDSGYGVQTAASSVANSASNSTVTPAAVLTIAGYVFRTGRAYSIRMGGGASSNVSGTGADFRVFKSVAGVLGVEFGEFYRVPCSLGGAVVPAFGEIFVKNNTGADITTDVALGLASTTAGNQVTQNAGAGRQRYLLIEDKGDASKAAFTNATVVS